MTSPEEKVNDERKVRDREREREKLWRIRVGISKMIYREGA